MRLDNVSFQDSGYTGVTEIGLKWTGSVGFATLGIGLMIAVFQNGAR